MIESVIQIKSEIMINVDVSVKLKNLYAKYIIFEILIYVIVKMLNIQQLLLMIQWLGVRLDSIKYLDLLEFINGTRHLVLFRSKKYDFI